jgi:hypothetical protein
MRLESAAVAFAMVRQNGEFMMYAPKLRYDIVSLKFKVALGYARMTLGVEQWGTPMDLPAGRYEESGGAGQTHENGREEKEVCHSEGGYPCLRVRATT